MHIAISSRHRHPLLVASGNSGSNIPVSTKITPRYAGFPQSPLGRLWRGVVLVALVWPFWVSDQQRDRISAAPVMALVVRLWAVGAAPGGHCGHHTEYRVLRTLITEVFRLMALALARAKWFLNSRSLLYVMHWPFPFLSIGPPIVRSCCL